GGSGRGGLRRIGRALRDGARLSRVRRSGGGVGAGRELPRLFDRGQRLWPGGAGGSTGGGGRRPDGEPRGGGGGPAATGRRGSALPGGARERRICAGAQRGGRERRRVSTARSGEPEGVRGRRRPLLGVTPGGKALRRPGGRARGRRQLRGAGGGLSGQPGRGGRGQ